MEQTITFGAGNNYRATVIHGETCTGDTLLEVGRSLDDEGNSCDEQTLLVGMDNHSMYELAMTLLKLVDVEDTRGSR